MKSRFATLAAGCLLAVNVGAQERLSDAPSPRQQVQAGLDWAVPVQSPLFRSSKSQAELHDMVARVPRLDLRLDTSDWVGRRVRIYMRMPSSIDGLSGASGLRMNWRGDGVFEDGALTPGDRALLFAGAIDEPVLRGVIDIEFRLDAGVVSGLVRFDPIYEIEPEGAG